MDTIINVGISTIFMACTVLAVWLAESCKNSAARLLACMLTALVTGLAAFVFLFKAMYV